MFKYALQFSGRFLIRKNSSKAETGGDEPGHRGLNQVISRLLLRAKLQATAKSWRRKKRMMQSHAA